MDSLATFPYLRPKGGVIMRRLWVLAPLFLLLAACAQDEGGNLSPGGAASSKYCSIPYLRWSPHPTPLSWEMWSMSRPGSLREHPPDDIQLSHADLEVKEVLYGSADMPSTVTVETLQFVAPEPDWRASGNTVLAFVKLSTEQDAPGIYYPINEQSIFLLSGTDVLATTDHDSFSERVSALTVDEILNRIERAKGAIAAGRVSAQTPVGG